MTKNPWGEEIDESNVSSVYKVPEEERLDTDEGEGADALGEDREGVDTGDDLGDWKPGDPE